MSRLPRGWIKQQVRTASPFFSLRRHLIAVEVPQFRQKIRIGTLAADRFAMDFLACLPDAGRGDRRASDDVADCTLRIKAEKLANASENRLAVANKGFVIELANGSLEAPVPSVPSTSNSHACSR